MSRPFFILPESRRRFLLWGNISPVTPAAARDTAGWEYCCVSPQRGVMWSQAGPPGGLGPGPARLWSPSTKPRGRRRGGRWGWGGGSEGRPGHIHSRERPATGAQPPPDRGAGARPGEPAPPSVTRDVLAQLPAPWAPRGALAPPAAPDVCELPGRAAQLRREGAAFPGLLPTRPQPLPPHCAAGLLRFWLIIASLREPALRGQGLPGAGVSPGGAGWLCCPWFQLFIGSQKPVLEERLEVSHSADT